MYIACHFVVISNYHIFKNQMNGVANYIEREVKRRAFVEERWNFREKEKRELEAEIKKRAGGVSKILSVTCLVNRQCI